MGGALERYEDDDRSDVAKFVPLTVRSVLDVGCLGGAFGALLKQARPGIEVWGIEPDETALRMAEIRLDRVIKGWFPDSVPCRSFDCVIFNDVLEHLVDPHAALDRARSLLTPGGCVIASIPNVRHFTVVVPLVVYGRWTYHSAGLLDQTHVRFFTRSSMIALFEGCGYRIDRVEGIRLSNRKGMWARILHLFGSRATEFLAQQYLIAATPRMA